MLQSDSVFLGDDSISGDSLLIVVPILWSLVSMFCCGCALLFVLNNFAIIWWGRKRAGWFTLFLFPMSCDSYGCGCSLRCCWCDCVISWSCSHAFYSCVALSQQAESHYFFYLIYASFWNSARMSVEIQPCNCWYYNKIPIFYVINRPGPISVWALVFELAQLTCQIRFDCKNFILVSSATLLDTLYCQFAVANVL